MTYQPMPSPAKKRKVPVWAWIVGGIAGLVLLCSCGIGTIMTVANGTDPVDQSQSTTTPPANEVPGVVDVNPVVETTTEEPPPAAPQSLTFSGSGNTITNLDAPLEGRYRLDWSVNAFTFTVFPLKGDGSNGNADWGTYWLNELGEVGVAQSGSTIVEASQVTMIQTDNVASDGDGSWTLTFTPLG